MELSRSRRLVDRTHRRVCHAIAVLVLVGATAVWPDAGHATGAEPSVVFQGAIPLPNRADDADGNAVEITKGNGSVMVNDARVVKADVMADNGVVHVIDTVLLPQ